jgi:hypothetical protein
MAVVTGYRAFATFALGVAVVTAQFTVKFSYLRRRQVSCRDPSCYTR